MFHGDVFCCDFGCDLVVGRNYSSAQIRDDSRRQHRAKGAITSKIKHAIKLKTSPARLAQLLQPSLACPGRCAVIGCKLKQNANEGCNSCASLARLVLSFIACFMLLVITP